MTVAVSVEGLSKKFVIGHERERYRALRDVIAGLWRPRRAARELEDFWALRDVNLEIREGERLGIIGRNGAGKSTLLKVLSRITEPSAGQVRIRGRVASLLEVGTGFHPELTGRENIFLNGAILGMTRADIHRRFDDIVEFAEVSRFLDTPVKRYSSGMYVRLAFAVAAHLEPDILVVDEVLAVGDATFQKKCIGKMDDVARSGRTVIFVSHSMDTVLRLCTRAIMLKEGRLHRDGPVEQVIADYLHAALDSSGELAWPDNETAPGNRVARLLALRTRASDGTARARFSLNEPVDIEVDYSVLAEGRQISLALELTSATDQQLIVAFDRHVRGPWATQPPHPAGRFRTVFRVPANLLNEGEIGINLRIFSPPLPPNEEPHVRLMRGLQFAAFDPMDGSAARGSFPHHWGAPAMRPFLETRTERLS